MNKSILKVFCAAISIALAGCDQNNKDAAENSQKNIGSTSWAAKVTANRDNNGNLTFFFQPGFIVANSKGNTSVIHGFDECQNDKQKYCIKVNKDIKQIRVYVKDLSELESKNPSKFIYEGDKPNETLNVRWLSDKDSSFLITRKNGEPLHSWSAVFTADTKNEPLSNGGEK
ncbi:hypothetical protein CEF37_004248 [Escherichia coli]|nr:hypothetical protein [Escherichia coli]